MATVQNIVDNARFETSIDSGQYTDVKAIIAFNDIYHECENILCMLLKDEGFNRVVDKKIDLLNGVNSYDFPGGSSTVHDSLPQLKKLLRIEVKYTANGTYNKAVPFSHDGTPEGLVQMETIQSKSTPKFIFTPDGFQLYPKPTEDVTDGVIIDYQKSNIDLVIGSLEADINIPRQYHDVIQAGVEWKIFKARRKLDEAQLAKQNYNDMKKKMIQELSDRYMQPITVKEFYPTDLMY